jgi:protocatechuate 3,4-dioxygenase alpha subunit
MLREDARRNVLVQPETRGERIRIEGRVLDGDGESVPDAVVEIWQANAQGRYNHPADTLASAALDPTFMGFGRSGTDETGSYWFETVKPGSVPFDESHMQAPHICVMVFARGLLNHVVTRLYFADEPFNEADPILQRVPTDRRHTLIARRAMGSHGPVHRFDIVLQGPNETAFFNV